MAGYVAMAESQRASRVTHSQEVSIVKLRAMGSHRRAVQVGTVIALVLHRPFWVQWGNHMGGRPSQKQERPGKKLMW